MLELADGGTLMLDEQARWISRSAKFLVFSRTSRASGWSEDSNDVRVVAATNRDLRQMVEEKRARQDLYYRLHVVELRFLLYVIEVRIVL